jgi:hypothetical protein
MVPAFICLSFDPIHKNHTPRNKLDSLTNQRDNDLSVCVSSKHGSRRSEERMQSAGSWVLP